MNLRIAALASALASAIVSGCAGTEIRRDPVDRDPVAEEIDRLIDSLVTLASFDTGLSTTHSGSDFPPVHGQDTIGVAVFGQDAPHARHPALPRLVAMGTRALPALLRHLDDKRPTQLTITHGFRMGGMWHAREVYFREGDAREVAALTRAGYPVDEEDYDTDESIEKHVITVGDVCFVAIGMITNRGYAAVRYQPTACQVINSPTTTPLIAKAVREVWNVDAMEDALRVQLLGDLAGENPFFSDGAATRLLYYFPEIATDTVLALFEKLRTDEDEKYRLRDLLRAISWCPRPKVRDRIQALVLASDDPRFIYHGAAAFAHADQPGNFGHLVRLADRMKADLDNGVNASEEVLGINLTAFPEKRDAAIQAFLRGGSYTTKISACRVLYDFGFAPVADLAPLLEVRAPGLGKYVEVGPGVLTEPDSDDFRPYRLCDNAYELISRQLGDTKTVCTGSPKDMNRRIAALRKRLTQPRAQWAFNSEEIAARQLDANRAKLAREARMKRIEGQGGPSTPTAYLVVTDPGSLHADLARASLELLTPTSWDTFKSVSHMLINRGDEEATHAASLSAKQRDSMAAALSRRLLEELDRQERESPGSKAYSLAALLVRLNESGGTNALERYSAKLRESITADKPPRDMDLSHRLKLLDEMVFRRSKGAGRTVRHIFETLGAKAMKGFFAHDEFLELLANNSSDPDIHKILLAMFDTPNEEWHLSQTAYEWAKNYRSANLIQVPVFRKALKMELADQRVIGQLWVEETEDGRSWHVEWVAGGTQNGEIDNDEPVAIAAGKGKVPMHHSDALLHVFTNRFSLRARGGPDFRVYWPLGMRQKAREAWIEFLAKPHPKER